MSLADELLRIAEEAARLRERLGELSQACAELRARMTMDAAADAGDESDTTREDAPRKLQSVS